MDTDRHCSMFRPRRSTCSTSRPSPVCTSLASARLLLALNSPAHLDKHRWKECLFTCWLPPSATPCFTSSTCFGLVSLIEVFLTFLKSPEQKTRKSKRSNLPFAPSHPRLQHRSLWFRIREGPSVFVSYLIVLFRMLFPKPANVSYSASCSLGGLLYCFSSVEQAPLTSRSYSLRVLKRHDLRVLFLKTLCRRKDDKLLVLGIAQCSTRSFFCLLHI